MAESNREDYHELSVAEDFCLVRKRIAVYLETVFVTILRRHHAFIRKDQLNCGL